MQARRIARELALLSLSQLPANPDKLQAQDLTNIVLAAVRTLTSEVHDTLETAGGELERASDRLLSSEINAVDLTSAREMIREALDLARNSVNRLGIAMDMPEFIQLSNQQEVRDYALDLLMTVRQNREAIDGIIANDMVNWQMHRLPRIDQDILRMSVAELRFMGVPDRVAINEAVELAKRYSGEEGYRFINGVLRRVSDTKPSKPSVS